MLLEAVRAEELEAGAEQELDEDDDWDPAWTETIAAERRTLEMFLSRTEGAGC